MSDSIKTVTENSTTASPLLEPYVAAVAVAQRKLQLATMLVQELKSKPIQPKTMGLGGYCAQAHLLFPAVHGSTTPDAESVEALLTLLRAFPPVELIDIVGEHTVKPLTHLRENERWADLVPCFPLVRKDLRTATLRWWTQLSGDLVEVQLPEPPPEVMALLHGPTHVRAVYSGGACVFHRKLQDYRKEVLFPEEIQAHQHWEGVFRDSFLGRDGIREWAQELYLFVYKRFVPSKRELREPAMPFNRNAPRPDDLMDTEENHLLEAVIARVQAEKEVDQVLRRLLTDLLTQAKDLLAKELGVVKARDGNQSGAFSSTLVTDGLQQKIQRKFGDVRLSYLREEAGFFKGRLVVKSPVFENSVGFLDFQVKGNPEGELITIQRLEPEYVDVAYPWE